MKLIYQFTPDERRVVTQAQERYALTVQVISDLHPELKGQLVISPDLNGFLGETPDQPQGTIAATPERIP